MSNFLTALTDRALSRSVGLRPRLPSLFEPRSLSAVTDASALDAEVMPFEPPYGADPPRAEAPPPRPMRAEPVRPAPPSSPPAVPALVAPRQERPRPRASAFPQTPLNDDAPSAERAAPAMPLQKPSVSRPGATITPLVPRPESEAPRPTRAEPAPPSSPAAALTVVPRQERARRREIAPPRAPLDDAQRAVPRRLPDDPPRPVSAPVIPVVRPRKAATATLPLFPAAQTQRRSAHLDVAPPDTSGQAAPTPIERVGTPTERGAAILPRTTLVVQPRVAPYIPPPAAPAAPAAPPAPIHVTIGRIEVRAVSAPAQSQRPRSRSRTMSLDEYLRRRAEGDRP